MRIRKGFTDFSANKEVDLAPRPTVAPAPTEILMKRRRLVFMVGDINLVGRLCQTPLAFHRNALQFRNEPDEPPRSYASYWRRHGGRALASQCITRANESRIIKDVNARDSLVWREAASDRVGN